MTQASNSVPKIIIRCSNIIITRTDLLNPSSLESLKELLICKHYIYIPNMKRSIPKEFGKFFVEDLQNNNIRIPICFPIEKITNIFPALPVVVSNNGIPTELIDIDLTVKTFKDENQEIAYEKIFNASVESTQVVFSAETAFGKAYLACRLWCEHRHRMLAVFGQLTHLETFKAEALKFTSIKEEEIMILNSYELIEKYYKMSEAELRKYKLVLATHRTIKNTVEKTMDSNTRQFRDINLFSLLINKLKIGFKFVDEIQMELKSLGLLELLTNIKYNLYVSATVSRVKNTEKTFLKYLIDFGSIISIPKKKRVEVEFISTNLNSLPDSKFITGSNFIIPNYLKHIKDDQRIDKLMEIIIGKIYDIRESDTEGSIAVVLGSSLDFVDLVFNYIKENVPEISISEFSSRNSNKLKETDRDIIVTTDKSFNGSLNIQRLTYIISFIQISNEIGIEQIVGRMRGINGSKCILYDIYDNSSEQMIRMMEDRKRTYKRIAKSIKESS